MMRYLIKYFAFSLLLIFVGACVDDYQDANPPALKDSPDVWSVTAAEDVIGDGNSTQITIVVSDCPAGIDSVGYRIEDADGDPIGTVTIDNLAAVKGKTKADIIATYTSVANTAAVVELTFIVYDKQFDEKGEVVRKSSVPKSDVVTVVCPSDLAGTYSSITNGASTDGGANNNPLVDLPFTVTITETSTPGTYDIVDASGGAYDAWYSGVYYGGAWPQEGTLSDACGDLSLAMTGPWGEGIIATNGSVDNGVITVYAMNAFGDEWTMVLTPQ